jgi:hypothetical protein
VFARDPPVEALELLFRLSIMTWVRDKVPVGIGVEDLQTHVDAHHAARLDMFTLSFGLDAELSVVAISAAQEANSLDLLDWEGFDVLSAIADQAQSANAAAIGEGDVASIGVELPCRLFVLHTPIVMLKLGIALLAGLVVAAILIEAGDGSPGPIRTGLTSLGIEAVGKRVLFGEKGTIALQVVLINPASVHPQAQALVANELHHADRFIESGILLRGSVQLVLVDQHASCPFLYSLLYYST